MPTIWISDIGSEEDLNTVTRRIIFPYRRIGEKFSLIPEDELALAFPKAYKYLSECRVLLESRDKERRSYENWYAWGRTQGRHAPGPKLLTKTFSKVPRFFLDDIDRLFCNGYGLFPSQKTLFRTSTGLQLLKIIWESRVMHYFIKITAFQIDGNFQYCQKNFIERFSIPELSKDDKEAILHFEGKYREVLIARLYDICETDISDIIGPASYSPTANHSLQSRILVLLFRG